MGIFQAGQGARRVYIRGYVMVAMADDNLPIELTVFRPLTAR
jgi:hypothetical protein